MELDTNYDAMEKWDFINKVFTPEDIFVIDGVKRAFRYGPDNIMDCTCSKCGGDQKVSFRFSIFDFFALIQTQHLYKLDYFLINHLKLMPSEQRSMSFQKLLWLHKRHQRELEKLANVKQELEAKVASMGAG